MSREVLTAMRGYDRGQQRYAERNRRSIDCGVHEAPNGLPLTGSDRDAMKYRTRSTGTQRSESGAAELLIAADDGGCLGVA